MQREVLQQGPGGACRAAAHLDRHHAGLLADGDAGVAAGEGDAIHQRVRGQVVPDLAALACTHQHQRLVWAACKHQVPLEPHTPPGCTCGVRHTQKVGRRRRSVQPTCDDVDDAGGDASGRKGLHHVHARHRALHVIAGTSWHSLRL